MPEYQVIGNSFHLGPGINWGDYHGRIVASRDAFYLCIRMRPDEVAATHFAVHGGGLIGALVYGAVRKMFKRRPLSLEFDYTTLPPEITAHPDWPVEAESGSVIVVPREIIKRVHYGFWSTYDLVCDGRTYCIGLSFLARSKALAFLREKGWEEKLDHAGSPSVVRQLAPLWCLALGAVGGIAIKLAQGAPLLEGRGAAIEWGAIGAGIGLAVGTVIYLMKPKVEAR